MTSTLQLAARRLFRKTEFHWLYGTLLARLVTGIAVASLLVLAAATWQVLHSQNEAGRLSGRLAGLQRSRTAAAQALQADAPPDVIQTLPDAPSTAEVVQTLHLAADKEGAQVLSLQAEDHPPTPSALGHLDLVLSVKAPYPSLLVVIQQLLDRYPGATVRRLMVETVVSGAPAAATGAAASQPLTEAETHLTLAFWRRPLGVESLAK